MFARFTKPLPVGTPAPMFTLFDQDGNTVGLSSFRGKNVVLIFYPADETAVCTQQLCEFRDKWELARQKNTFVFGVNPGNAAKHAAFRDHHKFPFPILVDERQRVGALYKTRALVPARTVYLIGPDGNILFARRGKPEPDEVLAAAVV